MLKQLYNYFSKKYLAPSDAGVSEVSADAPKIDIKNIISTKNKIDKSLETLKKDLITFVKNNICDILGTSKDTISIYTEDEYKKITIYLNEIDKYKRMVTSLTYSRVLVQYDAGGYIIIFEIFRYSDFILEIDTLEECFKKVEQFLSTYKNGDVNE